MEIEVDVLLVEMLVEVEDVEMLVLVEDVDVDVEVLKEVEVVVPPAIVGVQVPELVKVQ